VEIIEKFADSVFCDCGALGSMKCQSLTKRRKGEFLNKVENILKGCLDSIPSPSVKIQIVGWKFCLRCKGKTLLGFLFQKFVDITQQCFCLITSSKLSCQ
jgi:hypothetical protein